MELIETLWNVNSSKLMTYLWDAFELIETLWNVNCVFLIAFSISFSELIETLWNVNDDFVQNTFYIGERINRNIVECK